MRPSCHFFFCEKKETIYCRSNTWSLSITGLSVVRRPRLLRPVRSSAASFPVASRLSCTGALPAFTPFAEGVGLIRCQTTVKLNYTNDSICAMILLESNPTPLATDCVGYSATQNTALPYRADASLLQQAARPVRRHENQYRR